MAAPEYEGERYKVLVVSDDSLNVPKNSYDSRLVHLNVDCYHLSTLQLDSLSEKPARQTLFTALTRQLAHDTIFIVDGMNYIKGFRYQIYCAAREAGVRTCTVSTLYISSPHNFNFNP
jgi:protein KTI12